MKRRIVILIFIAALLLSGLIVPVGAVGDGEHPITLTVTCDPSPELEGAGTVPDLKFTIRNNSNSDYTLLNAKLSGGYEDLELMLDESGDPITVIAGGTKEFDLYDVAVAEDQLDIEVIYTLSWDEAEILYDEETEDFETILHPRETTAPMTIERFIVPELSVSAFCEDDLVRADGKFTVEYTIKNDTLFDVTGLKLYEPEQSMQTIPLPQDTLNAGESLVVPVQYTMGTTDMSFKPTVEYVGRRRNLSETAEAQITVGSVVTALEITTEAHPMGEQGMKFFITVKNNGNRTLTNVCVFDEINTQIDKASDLPPGQLRTVEYVVASAPSADLIRTVRFHATATDALQESFTVNDTEAYQVTPFVDENEVHIDLSVEPQKPYYDEQGKLCVSFQFVIRCYGSVKLRNAVLTEETIFHDVVHYAELLQGESYYYTQTYQIDGIESLRFVVTAVDPANQRHHSAEVDVDLNALRNQSDTKIDPVYVYTTNPYMQDLDARFRSVLKIIAVIGLCVAAFCAVVCVVLYAVELRIRQKLPGEIEEDLEKALSATKRRMDDQLFSDAPTERFGYRAPTKLRSFGELTEEEARARRELYAKGLAEDLKRNGTAPSAKPARTAAPVRIDSDGTRVLPAAKTPARPGEGETAAFARPKTAPRPDTDAAYRRPSGETTVTRRPSEPVTVRPKDDTVVTRRPSEPVTVRPKDDTVVTRRPSEPVSTRPKDDTAVTRRPSEPVSTRPKDDTVVTRRPSEPVTVRPKDDTVVTRRPSAPVSTRPKDDTVITRRPSEPVTTRPKDDTVVTRRPSEPVSTRPKDDTVVTRRPSEPVSTRPKDDTVVTRRPSEPVSTRPKDDTVVKRIVLPRTDRESEIEPAPAAPVEVRPLSEKTVPRVILPRIRVESPSESRDSFASKPAAEGASFLHRAGSFDEPAHVAVPEPEEHKPEPILHPKEPPAVPESETEEQKAESFGQYAAVEAPAAEPAQAFPFEEKVSTHTGTDEVPLKTEEHEMTAHKSEEPDMPLDGTPGSSSPTEQIEASAPEPAAEEAAEVGETSAPEPNEPDMRLDGTPGSSSPTDQIEASAQEPAAEEAAEVGETSAHEPNEPDLRLDGTPGSSSPTDAVEAVVPEPNPEEPAKEPEESEASASEPISADESLDGTPGSSSPADQTEALAPEPASEEAAEVGETSAPEPVYAPIVFPIPSFLRKKGTPISGETVQGTEESEASASEPDFEEPAKEQEQSEASASEPDSEEPAKEPEETEASASEPDPAEPAKEQEQSEASASETISADESLDGTPGSSSPADQTEAIVSESDSANESLDGTPGSSSPAEVTEAIVSESDSADESLDGTPGSSSPTESTEAIVSESDSADESLDGTPGSSSPVDQIEALVPKPISADESLDGTPGSSSPADQTEAIVSESDSANESLDGTPGSSSPAEVTEAIVSESDSADESLDGTPGSSSPTDQTEALVPEPISADESLDGTPGSSSPTDQAEAIVPEPISADESLDGTPGSSSPTEATEALAPEPDEQAPLFAEATEAHPAGLRRYAEKPVPKKRSALQMVVKRMNR